jgi:hypothetical protein
MPQHYDGSGSRISKKVYDYIASNPKFAVDGDKIIRRNGTAKECMAYRIITEADKVKLAGKY